MWVYLFREGVVHVSCVVWPLLTSWSLTLRLPLIKRVLDPHKHAHYFLLCVYVRYKQCVCICVSVPASSCWTGWCGGSSCSRRRSCEASRSSCSCGTAGTPFGSFSLPAGTQTGPRTSSPASPPIRQHHHTQATNQCTEDRETWFWKINHVTENRPYVGTYE